jgi:predicted nucleic acid-binding protein
VNDSPKSKKIVDVNVLAIFLVENHPGYKFVREALIPGLKGHFTPVILDIIPIRAFWIMTNRWGLEKGASMDSIKDFIRKYREPEYVGLGKEALMRAFVLSMELRHDVYDCVYLSLAAQEEAEVILTTDTDFEKLCPKKGIKYENPVPPEILKKFELSAA